MSDKDKAPPQKGRRRASVEGQALSPEEKKKKVEPRPLKDILGDPKRADVEVDPAAGAMYNPVRLEQFLRGQITLGDLEGITKQEQYEMAKIGFSYLTSGKLANAKTVFEGLLALDPFDAYFHTALGSIAQQENQLEEAEKRYSRALEINPFSPVAFANRGEVRISMGHLADGAKDLIRALEEDPNGTMPSTLRARATIQVVRDQLAQLDLPPLPPGMKTTGSKVPVVAPKPAAAAASSTTTGPKVPAVAASAPKPAAQTTPPAAATKPKAPPPAASTKPPAQAKDEEPRAARAKRPPPRRPGKK